MVLWTLFAVIVFLCGSTCAKTDNDYDYRRQSSSSTDLMQKGLPRIDGDALSCRYSKLLSVLKNIHLDGEAKRSFDNVKVKNNCGPEHMEVDSFEENNQDETTQFEVDDNSGDFLNTYENRKRGINSPIIGCDCKIKNDLLDLGHLHYPRYLLNAVCQKNDDKFENPPKCWRGAQCKPLEYKVRVLTCRSHNDHLQKDPTMSLLPDVLRSFWKFKTVTVAAGCFCS